MSTPVRSSTRQQKSLRTPTPRILERKKRLFEKDKDDDLLLTPLEEVSQENKKRSTKSRRNLTKFLEAKENSKVVSFFNDDSDAEEKVDKAQNAKQRGTDSPSARKLRSSKENVPMPATSSDEDEQLPRLFTSSMSLEDSATPAVSDMDVSAFEQNIANKDVYKKRSHDTTTGFSPETKQQRIHSPTKTSNEMHCIPTRSFYSAGKLPVSPNTFPSKTKLHGQKSSKQISPRTRREERSNSLNHINKGVRHKIRKQARPQHMKSVNVDQLLRNINNEKLRKLIVDKREVKMQIEQAHSIFRTNQNPIEMARPLSSLYELNNEETNNNDKEKHAGITNSNESGFADEFDFSDVEYDKQDTLVSNDAPQTEQAMPDMDAEITPPTNRKFFKSGHATNTRMQVKITGNIKATVKNGKITLLEAKPRNRKLRFSSEQATVDAILKDMDSSLVSPPSISVANDCAEHAAQQKQTEEQLDLQDNELQLNEDNNYDEFRKRLPYNTDDSTIIEQQQLLLEFLIRNNICTEENFTIFIAEPENHKEKAKRIVDKVILIDEEDPELQIAADFDEQAVDATANVCASNAIENVAITTHDFEITAHATATQNAATSSKPLYAVFYSGRCKPLEKPINKRRIWLAGKGANQYQIDAGQRNFGARQCHQCGLLYSVHEPEEEKLHRKYHLSQHVLRFRGWLDEDVVANHSDWGLGGRIVRMTENSNIKRQERLLEILRIVDLELGCSTSFVLPQIYVAYLAVRKGFICGLCLVQPLDKAHKYVCIDGVDCCSEETFDARCGVCRIWVSPKCRGKRVGSKLIRAVQLNTIFGEEIPLDKIGFSAPTQSGRLFAQHVTKLPNFLVYQ